MEVHIKSIILIAVAFVCQLASATSNSAMGLVAASVEVASSSSQESQTGLVAGGADTIFTAALEGNQYPRNKDLRKTGGAFQKKQDKGKHRPPPPGVKLYSDLEYARVDGQSLLLDLYMPENQESPPPLIIWIHGGGWKNGDKTGINPAAISLSGEGYALASLNYRLHGLSAHPEQIHDVKGAVRWLRANAKRYGYDTTRIGVGGGSAGGHLALLLGLSADDKLLEGDVGGNLDQSSRVQAIINLFGPSELQNFADVSKRFRENKSAAPEVLHSASPLTYLTRDDPPLLIMHGDQDKVVPLSQDQELHERYQQAGLDSSLHIISSAGHGGRVYSDSARQRMMKDFFDQHIKHNSDKKLNQSGVGAATSYTPQVSTDKKNVATGVSNSTSSKLHGFHWMVGPRSGLYGSEEKFNLLLRQIEQTLSTDPRISGVYLITHWDLIEAQEGKYDFERLDRVVNLIRSHGRYYKLAVAPGIYSPEWLYQKGAKAFNTLGSNPQRKAIYNKPVKIPLPWDSIYQSSYFAALEQVAKRYGNDEHFRAISLTAATFMSPEWHLPHSKDDRRQWKKLGAFDGKLEAAWKQGIDRFAKLFPDQFLIVEASSYPAGDKVLGDSVIDYAAKNYAGRFVVQMNQLTGRYDQIDRPTYMKLLDYRNKYGSSVIIGLQNLKGWSYPKMKVQQGSEAMTAFNYLQAEGEYWELWYGDGMSKETTERLNNFLDQGRKLGLKKFKEKLISEGQYSPPE